MARNQTDIAALYRAKRKSLMDAVSLIRRDDLIAVPILTGQPAAFLNALGERNDFTDLTIFGGLLIEPYPVLQQRGVRMVSGFFGPLERLLKGGGGRVEYLPADFMGWERHAESAHPRVVASALAPMDDDGFFSLGLHAGATFNVFLEAARDPERLAIGEVNRTIPRVFGLEACGAHRIHISEIDCVVESDRPAFQLPEMVVSEADRAIAAIVESLIEDGSTLQTGIGAIPNMIAQLLANGAKGDLGIHTEMLMDGIMELHRAGKVTNRKGIYDGYSVCTFAAGTAPLYQWMDRNPEVRMLPVAAVNDPAIIRQNRRMVSINGALAVDLNGQIMADTIGSRQYSGVGGHELFVEGARQSPGGKSIICLHAGAQVNGAPVSTIVAGLPPGTPITTPRHHVQYIVTEYGVADLSLATAGERARRLAAIAHPDFRDELRAAADALA